MPRPPRIALIDPLGGFGNGGVAYELAEGLAANGTLVDVFWSDGALVPRLNLPRHHGSFPVLGASLLRQLQGEWFRAPVGQADPAPAAVNPATVRDRAVTRPSSKPGALGRLTWVLRERVKRTALPLELASLLKARGYDAVWTHWPVLFGRQPLFWRTCGLLRLPVVHSVHNVLPHEGDDDPSERAHYQRVYRHAAALVVHSEESRRALLEFDPETARKIVVSRLGLYTMYPPPDASREVTRAQLGISDAATVVLCYGLVRPYKNVESVVRALGYPCCRNVVLIVCGKEAGYTDNGVRATGPLARTRALARELGVDDRVRFIDGPVSLQVTSDVMAASDVVALPYLKSYGSAVLLIAMGFGKYVIATATGGMAEYLADYPLSTLLRSPDPSDVAAALEAAAPRLQSPGPARPLLDRLTWPVIAKQTLKDLGNLVPGLKAR